MALPQTPQAYGKWVITMIRQPTKAMVLRLRSPGLTTYTSPPPLAPRSLSQRRAKAAPRRRSLARSLSGGPRLHVVDAGHARFEASAEALRALLAAVGAAGQREAAGVRQAQRLRHEFRRSEGLLVERQQIAQDLLPLELKVVGT